MDSSLAQTFRPQVMLGGLVKLAEPALLPGAAPYRADAIGDGLLYTFPKGALATARYLDADLLLAGKDLAVFKLALSQHDGVTFEAIFGVLAGCAARLRLPLEAANQNRWYFGREGARLRIICAGERVDLSEVKQVTLTVLRKGDGPVKWCLTPLAATLDAPPLLREPLLPAGPLLDDLGQSTQRNWPAKSRSPDEVTERLRAQLEAVPKQRWPESFSQWGGFKGAELGAGEFFRTHHDGYRWWLVDPAGHPFWSAGQNCVDANVGSAFEGLSAALTWLPDQAGPYSSCYTLGQNAQPTFDYLRANMIRAFGSDAWHERWSTLVLAQLKALGFNTVANWSDWRVARAAGFPYVRPLEPTFERTPRVFRDFPDVFHPNFASDTAAFAEALHETADDPALIGYFLMNEPTWGFATQTPAEGMLLNTPECATRRALSEFLEARYGSDAGLASAWEEAVTLEQVAAGPWNAPLHKTAKSDLEAFSTLMAKRFFSELSSACRKVDPNHLNLGARYYTVPPAWAVAAMTDFDVFSVNNYGARVHAERLAEVSARLNRPVLVGEWHFGALDVGLPASGIGRVKDQRARAQAFRVYTEDAASRPWCVGVHYFTLYDQSALGRYDGENYNIGFIDVCGRLYEPLAAAARASHERLYEVAQGKVEPYDNPPAYLDLLF